MQTALLTPAWDSRGAGGNGQKRLPSGDWYGLMLKFIVPYVKGRRFIRNRHHFVTISYNNVVVSY